MTKLLEGKGKGQGDIHHFLRIGPLMKYSPKNKTRITLWLTRPTAQMPPGRYSFPSEAGYWNLFESSFHGFLQKVKG
jgi:hypothetical protein